jgi:hypothetical protein
MNGLRESRMTRKCHVRFGGGRREKDAAGCLSLPLHYRPTNSGTRRTSPAAYPTTVTGGVAARFYTRSEARAPDEQSIGIDAGTQRVTPQKRP